MKLEPCEDKISEGEIRDWSELINGFSWKKRGRVERLSEKVIFGIPKLLRADLWSYLVGAKPDLYTRQGVFSHLAEKKLEKECEEKLVYDIPRTFCGLLEKYGDENTREKLTKILRAYSNFEEGVRYQQGMSMITLGILTAMKTKCEDVFWVLHRLLKQNRFGLKEIFVEGASKYFDQYDRLLANILPEVQKHLVTSPFKSVLISLNFFCKGKKPS